MRGNKLFQRNSKQGLRAEEFDIPDRKAHIVLRMEGHCSYTIPTPCCPCISPEPLSLTSVSTAGTVNCVNSM